VNLPKKKLNLSQSILALFLSQSKTKRKPRGSKMSEKESNIQINEAKSEIWEIVKRQLKIADGENGKLRVGVKSFKGDIVLQIIKLPKEEHIEEKGCAIAENATRKTTRQEPYTTTPKATK
jgi:hypothetical protein